MHCDRVVQVTLCGSDAVWNCSVIIGVLTYLLTGRRVTSHSKPSKLIKPGLPIVYVIINSAWVPWLTGSILYTVPPHVVRSEHSQNVETCSCFVSRVVSSKSQVVVTSSAITPSAPVHGLNGIPRVNWEHTSLLLHEAHTTVWYKRVTGWTRSD